MERKGVHHLGLTTLDIDRTMDFYTRILGWKVAWCDILQPPEGGRIKHAFMDTGDGTLLGVYVSGEGPRHPSGIQDGYQQRTKPAAGILSLRVQLQFAS